MTLRHKILFFFLLLSSTLFFSCAEKYNQLMLEIKAEETGRAQIFFDTGKGFNEEQSVFLSITNTNFNVYMVEIPSPIYGFRVDPINNNSTFIIKTISIEKDGNTFSLDKDFLAKKMKIKRDIESIESEYLLSGRGKSSDPHIAIIFSYPPLLVIKKFSKIMGIITVVILILILIVAKRKAIIGFINSTKFPANKTNSFLGEFTQNIFRVLSIPFKTLYSFIKQRQTLFVFTSFILLSILPLLFSLLPVLSPSFIEALGLNTIFINCLFSLVCVSAILFFFKLCYPKKSNEFLDLLNEKLIIKSIFDFVGKGKKEIKFTFIFSILSILLISISLSLSGGLFSKNTAFEVEMKSDTGGVAQVFYDIGRGFNPTDSVSFFIKGSDSFSEYKIALPKENIKAIRFDPIEKTANISIKRVQIITKKSSYSFSGEKLLKTTSLSMIETITLNKIAKFQSTGNDPMIVISKLKSNRSAILEKCLSIIILPVISLVFLAIVSIVLVLIKRILNKFLNKLQTGACPVFSLKTLKVDILLPIIFIACSFLIYKVAYEISSASLTTSPKAIIKMSSSVNDWAQMYFDTGSGYRENESDTYDVTGGDEIIEEGVSLPNRRIHSIRLDVLSGAGEVKLYSITFTNGPHNIVLDAQSISSRISPLNNIKVEPKKEGEDFIKLIATGHDPYANLVDIPNVEYSVVPICKARARLSAMIASILLALILSTYYLNKNKYFAVTGYIKGKLNSFADIFNTESSLIKYDYKSILFIGAILFSFIFTTTLKINGSSYGMYDYIVQQDDVKTVYYGSPRAIRSDEWKEAPMRFNPDNHSFSISTLLNPSQWGYMFLDMERGFSWEWNYSMLISILGLFILLMILTRSNFLLSGTGAIWMWFSAHTQWWSGIGMIGSASITVASLLYFLLSKRVKVCIISALLFAIFFYQYAIVFLYPPWQVPTGYLMLAITLGFLLGYKDKKRLKDIIQVKAGVVILGGVAGAILAYFVYQSSRSFFDTVVNTVYPGVRRFHGGGYSFTSLLRGAYDFFLTEGIFPSIWGNVCESSNYIMFFPIPLLLLLLSLFFPKIKKYPLEIALALYTIIISVWAKWGLPVSIEHITLMDYCSPGRILFPLGFASIIFAMVFLSKDREGDKLQKKIYKVISLLVILPIVIFGILKLVILLSQANSSFYADDFRRGFVVISFTAMTLFYILRKRLLFSVMIIIMIWPHIFVNPVNIGAGAILGKDIVKFAKTIEEKNNGAKWIVIGDPFKARIMGAVVDSVYNNSVYPNFSELNILDPQGKYSDIYNRYTAFKSVFATDSDKPIFVLNQQDYYSMGIKPNSPLIKEIGVKYVLFTSKPKPYHVEGMHLLNEEALNGCYIYSFKTNN